MIHENQSFRNERVELSDNTYHGCTFDHCELVYRGDPSPTFADNQFIDSSSCSPMPPSARSTFYPTCITRAPGDVRWWRRPSRTFANGPFAAILLAPRRHTHRITVCEGPDALRFEMTWRNGMEACVALGD